MAGAATAGGEGRTVSAVALEIGVDTAVGDGEATGIGVGTAPRRALGAGGVETARGTSEAEGEDPGTAESVVVVVVGTGAAVSSGVA